MSARMLVKGMLTWIPGVQRAFFDPGAGGGTASAAYCYGVWMKHLVLLREHGMQDIPRSVVELGPGTSIGTGVATLLSGAERYLGVDATAHMEAASNVAVMTELLRLFETRAPRPVAGFPRFDHLLDARLFPSHILDEAQLSRSLAPARVARIARGVHALGTAHADETMRYHTWDTLAPVPQASVDLLFSHVVMNQVEDLEGVYAACAQWVRPGGWMSHQIDCTALGTADEWNGHRAYSEVAWRIIAGRRPYFVNREPATTHLELMRRNGFDIMGTIRGRKAGGITRAQLAPRWRRMSDEDLETQTIFVVARRRADRPLQM